MLCMEAANAHADACQLVPGADHTLATMIEVVYFQLRRFTRSDGVSTTCHHGEAAATVRSFATVTGSGPTGQESLRKGSAGRPAAFQSVQVGQSAQP